MKPVLIYSLVLFGLFIPVAQAAEAQRPGQRVLNRVPTQIHQTTAVSDAKGRNFTRETLVQRSADGRSKQVTVTGEDGNSRSRSHEVEITRGEGERTRVIEGTNFRGEAYAGSSTAERTEDGYVRQTLIQGPDGKTRSAQADVVVDKEAGTVTKEVNIERANGEQASRTTVRTYNKENAAP